jgi:hypothetical protein
MLSVMALFGKEFCTRAKELFGIKVLGFTKLQCDSEWNSLNGVKFCIIML